MIIGITGFICSGKEEISKIFVEKYGFIKKSFGDEVRKEATKRGIELTRDNLQNLGNLLRVEEGKEVWARRIIDSLETGKSYVIEGFRNLNDELPFRELEGFVLIGIHASDEIRMKRFLERKREGDPLTEEDFKRIDATDRGNDQDPDYGQRSEDVYAQRDYEISNEGTLEDLRGEVERVMGEMKS